MCVASFFTRPLLPDPVGQQWVLLPLLISLGRSSFKGEQKRTDKCSRRILSGDSVPPPRDIFCPSFPPLLLYSTYMVCQKRQTHHHQKPKPIFSLFFGIFFPDLFSGIPRRFPPEIMAFPPSSPIWISLKMFSSPIFVRYHISQFRTPRADERERACLPFQLIKRLVKKVGDRSRKRE